jgi:glycerol-3-phosphate dehydrogenase (NAD(P)+)
MKSNNIGIIGAGNWGTTLALYLNTRSVNVTLFEPLEKRIKNLIKFRENKEFLPDYKIPDNIKLTSNPKELADKTNYVFFVLPSHILRNIAKVFADYINKEKTILSFTKGIDPNTLQRMSQIIEEEMPAHRGQTVAVSGPSIAREVIKKVPTSLVAASKSTKKAEMVQKMLSSEIIRVYTSPDIVGVELGGAFKNIYAIAAGICDGMKLGMNAKAALITRSMAELSLLGEKMGGNEKTFAGLSGFGDLIVTSFSSYSRNRTLGERLGRGENLKDIVSKTLEVMEGIRTTESICTLSEKYKVKLPVAKEVYAILYENKDPSDSIKDLMKRELKKETKK